MLYSDSGKRRRMLASNSKLFTTAAFLDRFGADGTLQTGRLGTRRARTGPNDQLLRGGLVLVGDGDPALAVARLRAPAQPAADELKPLAQGGPRGRASSASRATWSSTRRSSTASARSRSPGITGGPWLEHALRPLLRRGLRRRRLRRQPGAQCGAGLPRSGSTRAGREGQRPDAGRAARRASVLRRPTRSTRCARPTRRAADRPHEHPVRQLLRRDAAEAPRRARDSAPGHDRARRRRRPSGSRERSAAAPALSNGSGLSRTNKAVAEARSASSSPTWRATRTSTALPRLARRSPGAPARCRTACAAPPPRAAARPRPGTIDGVSALSGYCKSGNGLIAFSILMNGVNVDAARRAQDAMAAAIARYG